jgi:two-component system KDP operon response regulator KdpE
LTKTARRLLRVLLEPQGYRVFEADAGAVGLRDAFERKPDVIVLELALPDADGLDILRSLREWSLAAILVLSEKTEEETKVAALDAGAGDYLVKPFSGSELLARLRVLQRPLPNVPDGPLLIEGDLVVNVATHQIALNDRPIRLTRKEEALFYVLARYSGKVVTSAHLIRSVWGAFSEDRRKDLRVLVAHLRKKLAPYKGEMLIRTEDSRGYRLLLSDPFGAGLRGSAVRECKPAAS